jgi:hypothetical protein
MDGDQDCSLQSEEQTICHSSRERSGEIRPEAVSVLMSWIEEDALARRCAYMGEKTRSEACT